MAAVATINEPNLPWVDRGEDRGFKWLAIILLVVFMAAGGVMNWITLPEVERKNLVDVSPRLAKLILEKQEVKPPPPRPKPAPEKKEVEKKKEPPKKKAEKKPEPKKPEPKKTAREVAQQSGLIAMADDLADLREAFDLDSVAALPQQKAAAKEAVKVASTSDLLSASAQRSSGGIQSNTLSRELKTSELSRRQTTQVESNIQSDKTQLAKASTSKQQSRGGAGIRSADEIERVFQQNKGGIFNLYNRALRSNPALAGKVVVELTIAPNGTVKAAKILSSELGDKSLERKLVLKIKRFKFASSNVAEITVTYPIDFLPS